MHGCVWVKNFELSETFVTLVGGVTGLHMLMYFSQPVSDKSSSILNCLSTAAQPAASTIMCRGKATWGMSWGGHVVARHKGQCTGGRQGYFIPAESARGRKAMFICFPAPCFVMAVCAWFSVFRHPGAAPPGDQYWLRAAPVTSPVVRAGFARSEHVRLTGYRGDSPVR